jgi:hypothetical protein
VWFSEGEGGEGCALVRLGGSRGADMWKSVGVMSEVWVL